MRLIVTRPEPEATRTAQLLIRLGHVAILSPMLDIRPVADAPLPDVPHQAVLVTSGNAVRALAAHPQRARLAGMPLLAVGDATALEAKRAGFAAARSAGGAVADLAALVAAELHPENGPLLYAAGDVQTGDLAGALAKEGFRVDTVVVYRSEPRLRLSAVAAEALRSNGADGALLFSRRSAAAFALALRAADLAPLRRAFACFAISRAAADPVAALTAGPILVAERPDQISLFAAIERFAAEAASAGGGGDYAGLRSPPASRQ